MWPLGFTSTLPLALIITQYTHIRFFFVILSNVTNDSQADHLRIQEKIHQDLNRLRMVFREVQADLEVLEAHVLTHQEDPINVQKQL
jgi:hypothetical protein